MPQTPRFQHSLFWFRRDLRTDDNAGLAAALEASERVHCVFVFDTAILDRLPTRADRRVEFIWESVRELGQALQAAGGGLPVLHAEAAHAIPALAARLKVDAVFTNRDYEPQARSRDSRVALALKELGIAFETCKDTVVFETDEVLTQAGRPFSVFTPYKNAWLKRLEAEGHGAVASHPFDSLVHRLALPDSTPPLPELTALGFARTNLGTLGIAPGSQSAQALLDDFTDRMPRYQDARNFPAVKGVSYLSVHNRFGTISIRALARRALNALAEGVNPGARTWLAELIWRDFYFQILWHHPRVATSAFKPEYDRIRWANDPALLAAWREARTGYPIIDAAMRQLNQTGYMHNRLRMIVASFLTKDLHCDWRLGEQYFAEQLNDFDLAANNGGWQWAASTGCDAQPYFRIFNPITQSERFDPEGRFLRRYLPELARVPDRYVHAPWLLPPLEQQAAGCVIGRDYPAPVVDHAQARAQALALYSVPKAGADIAG